MLLSPSLFVVVVVVVVEFVGCPMAFLSNTSDIITGFYHSEALII